MYERNQDFRAWAEKEDICVKFNGYEKSKYEPRIYIYIYEKCIELFNPMVNKLNVSKVPRRQLITSFMYISV